jgi:hypothetical protein
MSGNALPSQLTSSTLTVNPRAVERRFFGVTTGLIAAIVTAGFAWTYYLRTQVGVIAFGPPNLPTLVRLHALASWAWVLLLVIQTNLIAVRRVTLHRKLGVGGGVVAVALVVLGWVVSIAAVRRGPLLADQDSPLGFAGTLQFLILPVQELFVFSCLVGTAFYLRKVPRAHKRLILLGTLALLPAATTRLAPPGPLMTLAMLGVPEAVFVLALAALDIRLLGRLHPATICGGALLLVCEASRLWIAKSALWLKIATTLVS